MRWSQLLRRVFALDVLRCPCGADRKIIGVLSRAQSPDALVGPLAAMAVNPPSMNMPDADKMARGRLLIIDAKTLAVEKAADIEIGEHPAQSSLMHRASRSM